MDKANVSRYPESDFRRIVITKRQLLQFQNRQYNGDFGAVHLQDDNLQAFYFPDDRMYKVNSISFIGDAVSVDFVSSKLVNKAEVKPTYRLLRAWALDHDLTIVYRLANSEDVWIVSHKQEGLVTRYVDFDGVVAGPGDDTKWASEMYSERELRVLSEQGDEDKVVLFDFVNQAEY